MTELEKKLLRQQAEAYAFIVDLRKEAIQRGDRRYILLTAGIEARVDKRREEYPRAFQRFFNDALDKAAKAREPQSGTRKEIPRREEEKEERKPRREKRTPIFKRKKE